MDKQIKERGITFNAEMVRAILDGRKTQTRQVIKSPAKTLQNNGTNCIAYRDAGDPWYKDYVFSVRNRRGVWGDYTLPQFLDLCPFGKVGDRLYVRETWGVVSHSFDGDGLMTDWIPDRPAKAIHEMPYGRGYYSGHAIYAADGDFTWGDDDGGGDGRSCWHPSIHMPKSASRITLEITDVRVERLQAITLGDICKELGCGLYDFRPATHGFSVWEDTWKSIYGQDSWQSNPFVWVVEFKRVEAA